MALKRDSIMFVSNNSLILTTSILLWFTGRICNNFLVNRALFDKNMKSGTGVDL